MFNKLTCKYSTTILLRYCQSYDRLTTDVWFFLTSYEERGVFLRYVLFLKSFSVCIHFTLCRFGLSTWIEVLIDWLIDWLWSWLFGMSVVRCEREWWATIHIQHSPRLRAAVIRRLPRVYNYIRHYSHELQPQKQEIKQKQMKKKDTQRVKEHNVSNAY